MDNTKRNVALISVAVVLIGFAAYRIVYSRSTPPPLPTKVNAIGVCLACQEQVEFTRNMTDMPPFHCPACGADAVYAWMYCYDCNRRFIPEMQNVPGQPPRPVPFPACTHCGCQNVSGYDTEDPTQAPIADAELPPWPQ